MPRHPGSLATNLYEPKCSSTVVAIAPVAAKPYGAPRSPRRVDHAGLPPTSSAMPAGSGYTSIVRRSNATTWGAGSPPQPPASATASARYLIGGDGIAIGGNNDAWTSIVWPARPRPSP